MFVLRRWLGNFKRSTPGKAQLEFTTNEAKEVIYAPGTRITYDNTLVNRLKHDHSQLITHFTRMVDAARQAEYPKIKPHMNAFLKLFNAHVLLEYTKLYIFLDHAFKHDLENYELIHEFKREMNEIGRLVRTFYGRWLDHDLNPSNVETFLKQAESIGKMLVHRINTEENRLYEVYDMAPGMFAPSLPQH